MSEKTKLDSNNEFLVSSKDYFDEMIGQALSQLKVKTYPMVSSYLVNLLQFYMIAENLFGDPNQTEENSRKMTLAEMYLTAANAEPAIRRDMYKKLGDTSLYISGFFGDSLKRKIVDIDYYADIGGSAYGHLAVETQEDTYAKVYTEFSSRFMIFVDVLTYISQKSLIQTNKDILRLYDRYMTTGSQLAKEQLHEKGILTSPDLKKASKQ